MFGIKMQRPGGWKCFSATQAFTVIMLLTSSLLHGFQTTFTGSKACQPCHAEIYKSYMQTGMATSSGPVGFDSTPATFNNGGFLHERSGYRYRVLRESERLVLEYRKADRSAEPVRRDMPWFVGSGAKARSYLLDVRGFLFQSPVAWYANTAKWDLAPGYTRNEQPYLSRPILPGCLQCHASGVRHIANTQNRYAAPPFLEAGISCERCHGPGSLHIRTVQLGVAVKGSSIVNPARLDTNRRDSVCAQCHLSGEVRVPRAGKHNQSFTPGELLSDYVAVFIRSGAQPGIKVTSHVENLAQSACKSGSRDRMSCTTCHDPHAAPAASKRASWFRSKCLGCHETSPCTESAARRQERADDCTSCHMPRSPVIDAEHVVYTDHSIPRIRVPKGDMPSPDTPLAAFTGAPAGLRDQGIAYAVAGQHSRAFELLVKSIDAQSTDSEALLYLAELYNRDLDGGRKRNRAAAIPLYERAIRLDPNQLTGYVSLGAIRMEQERYAEAIDLWTIALGKNPALVLVRFNLARALVKTGRRAEAEKVLEGALEFNPAFDPARQALEDLRRTGH
ncbi:MAG: tetratricopeptide repeat protein [Bryobacteraceae bacterium]|nr:tetratricopeptide repeat protein [Bryobacteraceae bacterium]